MGITAGVVGAVTAIGGAIAGNQAKQKAKGQAGQAERDAQAAQDAADAKLRAQHFQDIEDQAQAGAIGRRAIEGPDAANDPLLANTGRTFGQRPRAMVSTLMTPRPAGTPFGSPAATLPSPIEPTVNRKTLLGS